MNSKELYEITYKKKNHFSFGKNWKEFINSLDKEKIEEAKKSLIRFIGKKEKIRNKTFIDVGCGSGLFSLAAYLIGAKKILSIDVDDWSIWCAKKLKNNYAQKSKNWIIQKGSILNSDFIKKLGKYQIVYSWGVLHHTGNMAKAFKNIDLLVANSGLLYIAIYNKNEKYIFEGTSKLWEKIKRFYNSSNNILKRIIYWGYTSYLIFGVTISGKNPIKYIKNYKSKRGMNFFTDITDWLGGYPYEYAKPEEIITHFEESVYMLIKDKRVRSVGCNEFLFKKNKNRKKCAGY